MCQFENVKMKIWKAILFTFFLVLSFFVLTKDTKAMFSFYAIIAIHLSIIAILMLALWDYKHSKTTRSIFAFLGLAAGIFLFGSQNKYQDHHWQNELDLVMVEIDNYHSKHKEYPKNLSDLPITISNIGTKRHLGYFRNDETGNFVLEYNAGPSTVYNYNSESKSWTNYMDWGSGY